MYKGMKWYEDRKLWILIAIASAILVLIYFMWSMAGKPEFF